VQNAEKTAIAFFDSPIGPLKLVAENSALISLKFLREIPDIAPQPDAFLEQVMRQLDEYFRHKRQKFEIALAPKGTPFQIKVWQALLQIPYGQTASYKDIALAIGRPKAFRAVGLANGRNPIPIIIPCHRVIRTNGELGGFSSGLRIKRWLLKHEGIAF
jgi:methylated-DNA-[protein]-cysteine S-methyltransferase